MTEQNFDESEDRAYEELGEKLNAQPGLVRTLPDEEQVVARMIADGMKPYEIAMAAGMSEEAVWTVVRSLTNAIMSPTRRTTSRGYETAGMGADTDPGVTGGYGDTGFGSIGNEPPEPVTEEPDDLTEREKSEG